MISAGAHPDFLHTLRQRSERHNIQVPCHFEKVIRSEAPGPGLLQLRRELRRAPAHLVHLCPAALNDCLGSHVHLYPGAYPVPTEAEATWGGPGFVWDLDGNSASTVLRKEKPKLYGGGPGFVWDLDADYTLRVFIGFFLRKRKARPYGRCAFFPRTPLICRQGSFFFRDQRDRTQVQKKTTFFGSFFGAARVRISYVISSDGPFFATLKKCVLVLY